mgnify:CR=1 FL=1
MRLAKIGEDGLSEGVPEGASLPEGIDVDDAAAYFGVVESSDALQQMMAMESKQALSKALEHLSDIILQSGEFDFEAASVRLQCEGGEIYYLIFGHLNLMAISILWPYPTLCCNSLVNQTPQVPQTMHILWLPKR